MSDITSALVLRKDVALIPVRELGEDVRRTLDAEDDDVALSRPRTRTTSTVVDAAAARLLESFQEPRTIVEAVILFARREGVAPNDVLEDAYRLVAGLLRSGFMTPAGTEDEEEAPPTDEPTLAPGDDVEGLTIVRPVYLLDDTELYLVRDSQGDHAALKLQRPGSHIGGLLRREAEVLGHLEGHPSPRLGGTGRLDDRVWLQMEWCRGIDPESLTGMWRADGPLDRGDLLEVLEAVTSAYRALHERGVVHGDVHPRNVLIQGDGRARLLDFGFARLLERGPEAVPPVMRAGIPFFYEPEYARAALAGEDPPAASEAGEQYALSALLYLLTTGSFYLDFSLARESMLRELLERAPVPLENRGVHWPELEEVLFRGLEKEAADRFPSVAALGEALAALVPSADAGPGGDSPTAPGIVAPGAEPPGPTIPAVTLAGGSTDRGASALAAAEAEILERVGWTGRLLAEGPERPPRASVNFGAAGVSLALRRMSQLREDPDLLALADAWCRRAELLSGTPDAFLNEELEITPDHVGTAAPLHGRSGIAAVRASIARAMADEAAEARAVASFVEASREGHRGLDLTLGRCSTVLASAHLLEALSPGLDGSGLRELGNHHLAAVWEELEGLPAIPTSGIGNLGIAHGWAGFLYTTLEWHRATGAPLPPSLGSRLEELADLGEPAGRGVAWAWTLDGDAPGGMVTMPGWCNGTSGHTSLWTLAYRLFGEERWLTTAVAAGWDVWDAPDLAGSLCCGLVGRSYALLDLWRTSGDERWLRRARRLGERAARHGQIEDEFPHSLYKGRLSLAVLAADLERPEDARHPFFQADGWPHPPAERITLAS